MIHLTIVAGARPNFMKIAPIIHAIHNSGQYKDRLEYTIVHTGQHYDHIMSAAFFEELGIPEPAINLGVNGGSPSEQTAGIMIGFEKVLSNIKTDMVIVVGDVTSTMACAIVAKKMGVKVAHVEAGIRSNDMSMPEEINRILTDSISDWYYTTSEYANENLLSIGVDSNRIIYVGNVMIDTLLSNLHRIRRPEVFEALGLRFKEYYVLTLHRPANVDYSDKLQDYLDNLVSSVNGAPVIFPVHPRTEKKLLAISSDYPNLHLIKPLSYLEFIYLIKHSKAIITDSGGITEEATVLDVPCLTLRDSTERPETCLIGTNELIGTDPNNIKPAIDKLNNGKWKHGSVPKFWDGKTAERIVKHLLTIEQKYRENHS